MRGDEVRSIACVRQYADEKRDDVFAATPDTSFMKLLVSKAAADKDSAILIADISVALMHARMDEEIVVKPPPGVVTSKYWRLLAAVNGSRKASQLWQEHAATILLGHNEAILYIFNSLRSLCFFVLFMSHSLQMHLCSEHSFVHCFWTIFFHQFAKI